MAASNGCFLATDPPSPPPTLLPPWLSNSNSTSVVRPLYPSVTLSLSPSTMLAVPRIPWLQPERMSKNSPILGNMVPHGSFPCSENLLISELVDYYRELE
ncbi:hypothetical protein V6N13_006041 [Hibiscus sabdariffa]|uniref:Uncharacterized protein n=1 Tax=Hibiscus sabdariffa TaxID=183260 RepID=A0ABR2ENZ7_9ROSI